MSAYTRRLVRYDPESYVMGYGPSKLVDGEWRQGDVIMHDPDNLQELLDANGDARFVCCVDGEGDAKWLVFERASE